MIDGMDYADGWVCQDNLLVGPDDDEDCGCCEGRGYHLIFNKWGEQVGDRDCDCQIPDTILRFTAGLTP